MSCLQTNQNTPNQMTVQRKLTTLMSALNILVLLHVDLLLCGDSVNSSRC
jgi:hypothetical protein